MLAYNIAIAIASSFHFSWSLEAESTGFFTGYDTIGTYAGPISFDLPPGPSLSPTPTVTLGYVVAQMKGNPSWGTPWSDDLSVLGTDSEEFAFDWVGDSSEPVTFTFAQSSYLLKAIIQTDYHSQTWYGTGFGTAQRMGYWDSQVGYQFIYNGGS